MLTKKIKLLTCAFALLCGTAIAKPVTVNAAAAAPTDIAQTVASDTSVNLKWKPVPNAVHYNVQWSTDQKNWEYKLYNSSNNDMEEYSITELEVGTTYFVRVRAEFENETYSEWSTPIEICTMPEPVWYTDVKTLYQDDKKIKIEWKQSKGAQAYEIRFGEYIGSNSLKDSKPVAIVTTNNFEFTFPDYRKMNGSFIITPVRYTTVNGKKLRWDCYLTDVYSFLIIPKAPENIKISATNYKKKNVTFTFDRTKINDIANQCQIEIRDSKGKVITTKTIYNYEDAVAVLKSSKLFNQPFQFRMRSARQTQKDPNPVFGTWSEPITYIPDAACKKLTKKTSKNATLSFQKVSGAKSYTVYYSNNGKKWKAIVKNTKKTSVKVKYNKKKKNYYYVKANKVKFGTQLLNSSNPKEAITTYKFK